MRWNISPEQRQQVVEKLMALVEGDDAPVSIRAARLMIQMEQQNQTSGITVPGEPSEENENRFAEILRRIQTDN